ncbi:MAG TPA: ABC transporter ATP-binding protein [Candidatus Binatia bacterium]|nr:ABC transporter ATP-binding protein [Candidatus Binatia bacterium]
MIEARDISKSFGGTRALDAVSFTISEGEVVGLLGPNGSGKTTLLRILTAFFPPDRGSATVAGVRLADDPFEVRRRVGYLPERAPLYPDATVRRFLQFAARVKISDSTRRDERVAAVARECGLADVLHRPIGTLSKGYRQRVGIAQALVGRPHVLVLDEPTVGLDPAQVLELRQLITTLGGRTTIVLSSHILADVASVCDRVLILHRGKLVLAERVDSLRRQVQRAGELVLRTRGEEAALAALVDGVRGVGRLAIERADDGTLLAHLAHEQGTSDEETRRVREQVTAELARACIAAGWPLLELGPRSRTLEDLFVDLLERE